jgi:bacterial/archaeal transporter family protein
MDCVGWAVLGMVSYSTVTLMVKLATRTGEFNAFAVLAIAAAMVAIAAMANAWLGEAFAGSPRPISRNPVLYMLTRQAWR